MRLRSSGLLSISTMSDCLMMSLLSLKTFSCFGAFVPCGCLWGCNLTLSLETQSVVGIAVCTTRGPCDYDVMPDPLHHEDVVQQMPILRAMVHHDILLQWEDERLSCWWEGHVQHRFPAAEGHWCCCCIYHFPPVILPMMCCIHQPQHWNNQEWWGYVLWEL